jgi:hypothetical protein
LVGGSGSGVGGDRSEFFLHEGSEFQCGITGVFFQEWQEFICEKMWGVFVEPF